MNNAQLLKLAFVVALLIALGIAIHIVDVGWQNASLIYSTAGGAASVLMLGISIYGLIIQPHSNGKSSRPERLTYKHGMRQTVQKSKIKGNVVQKNNDAHNDMGDGKKRGKNIPKTQLQKVKNSEIGNDLRQEG